MRSNVNLLRFALRYWYIFVAVALVAGIMAVIFSGPNFIPPKFKSEAVLYPANLGVYSGETRLEQMQQYLQSNSIRDTIVNKFNLYEEYELDPEYKEAKSLMKYYYSEHIGFEETRFESIMITALSTNPVKAKHIVDEIIHQLNLTVRRTEREKYKEVMEIYRVMTEEKKTQIDSLEEEIQEYSSKYNIIDLETQSERVTEGYMNFLLQGKKGKEYEEAKQLYENLKKYGARLNDLHNQLEVINEEYVNRLHLYEKAKKDFNKFQTYSNVLVHPEVSDKKEYPIRWLIVLSAMVASSLFTFVVLTLVKYSPWK